MGRVIIMATSALGIVGIGGCTQQRPTQLIAKLTVQLSLGQSVAKMEGVAWPTTNLELDESNAIDTDADFTIHFPSGRKYSTFSRATFLSQRNGVVSDVTLTPLAETLSFQQALARVKAIAEELGVLQNDMISDKLRNYETNPPNWEDIAIQAAWL
jgi:hypothetical protein